MPKVKIPKPPAMAAIQNLTPPKAEKKVKKVENKRQDEKATKQKRGVSAMTIKRPTVSTGTSGTGANVGGGSY